MTRTRKLVLLAMLTSLALVLHYFEGYFPVLIPGVPGAKLGLANIITMVTLALFGWKEAFTIMVLRSVLGPLLGGAPTSILYSLAGGFLSTCVMSILYHVFGKYLSFYGISIAGAVFHNIGQLGVAALLFSNYFLFTYLPVMTVIAIPTGVFVALAAQYMLRFVQQTRIVSKNVR